MSRDRIYDSVDSASPTESNFKGMFEVIVNREYTIRNTPVTPLSFRTNAHFGRVFSFYGAIRIKVAS